MKIRPAEKKEIKTLQDLNDEVFIDNSKYDTDLNSAWAQSETGKKYFTEALNNSQTICLIAEEDNKPIGYLIAAPKNFSHRLSRYIEIENMGVSPTYRSKGIGRKLFEKCVEIAKKRGFQKIYVNSYFKNVKAVTFYEKCGLKKIDICLEKNI